jgi:hypothetical protein
LTLDDDVAAKLRTESRRTGRAFKEVVNDFLRRAFALRRDPARRKPFVVEAHDLGLRSGLSYDDLGELLEQVEGPRHA